MTAIGEVFATVRPDTERFAQEARSSLQGLAPQFTQIGAGLSAAITAPLVGASAAAFGLATSLGNTADELLDLEAATGISTDTLQEFRAVTRAAGTEQDALGRAAEQLTRRMSRGEEGSADMRRAIDSLGVSLTDSTGSMRSMDDLMPELIGSLGDIDDATERARLGNQLFSSSWRDLAPVVALGADEIDRVTEAARASGEVMSREALQSADAFRREWVELRNELGLVLRSLAADLIPTMRDTLVPLIRNTLVPALQSAVGFVGELAAAFGRLPNSVQVAAIAMAGLAAAAGPALITVGLLIPAIGAAATALAGLAGPIAIGAVVVGLGAAFLASEDARGALGDLAGTVTDLAGHIADLAGEIAGLVGHLGDLVNELGLVDAVMDEVSRRVATATLGLRALTGAAGLLNDGLNRLRGESAGAAQGMRDIDQSSRAAALGTGIATRAMVEAAGAMNASRNEARALTQDLATLNARQLATAFANEIMAQGFDDVTLAMARLNAMAAAVREQMRVDDIFNQLVEGMLNLPDVTLPAADAVGAVGGAARGAGGALRDAADDALQAARAFAQLDSRGRAVSIAQDLIAMGARSVEEAMNLVHPAAVQMIRDLMETEELTDAIADALQGVKRELEEVARASGAGGDLLGGLLARREALQLSAAGAFGSDNVASNVVVNQEFHFDANASNAEVFDRADTGVEAAVRGSLAEV